MQATGHWFESSILHQYAPVAQLDQSIGFRIRGSWVRILPGAPILIRTSISNKIKNKHTSLFVLEAAGLPIGQIRFEEIGDEAWIDYSLDSIVRGRGWGTRLVALGMDLLKSDKPVHFCAEVKPNNKVSRSIFLRLGFVEKEDRGKVFYYDNLKSSKLAERLHS